MDEQVLDEEEVLAAVLGVDLLKAINTILELKNLISFNNVQLH